MPKGSKKGACSAHVEAAKANCLEHARREGKVPGYVNPHLTPNNRTVFEDDLIKTRKSIVPLVKRAEIEYSVKTGQKCQKSFTPFREDVLKLKEGITDEQLMAFKSKAEALTGWKVLGIWLHQDEGHAHSKYIEGDENFQLNIHAHVLYDCQDHTTGKAIRPQRKYFSMRQDLLAESTGMERGNRAADTGIRHRKSAQQRILAQEQRISELERIAREREKKHQEELKEMAKKLKKLEEEKVSMEENAMAEGKQIQAIIDKYNGIIDDLKKKAEEAEESDKKRKKQAEAMDETIKDKESLLKALNDLIANARATAVAMGVEVSAKCQSTSNGIMLYAYAGKQPLPPRTLDRDDFVAFKSGRMPVEILVAKYHPAIQPSPKVVEQYVKNNPKR